MSKFTHINEQGNAKMVDVSNKNITKRTAQAHSSITVNETIYQQIIDTAYSSKLFEDPLTKTKAVEDFQTTWHEKCLAKSSIS